MNEIQSKFVIVSAYTKRTNYENIIKSLKGDCEKHNIPFSSIGYDPTGSWVENTMLKPKLILQNWDGLSYFYKNLIWIDADARIESFPKYFIELDKQQIDFSIFRMGAFSRVTSGTIFFRLNDKMKEFVTIWNKECLESKERNGDQHCLRNIIAKGIYGKLKVLHKDLPYSYCYVYDDSLRRLSKDIPKLKGNPVIKHMQASRDRNNAKSI
jgi:hypothetical protein